MKPRGFRVFRYWGIRLIFLSVFFHNEKSKTRIFRVPQTEIEWPERINSALHPRVPVPRTAEETERFKNVVRVFYVVSDIAFVLEEGASSDGVHLPSGISVHPLAVSREAKVQPGVHP